MGFQEVNIGFATNVKDFFKPRKLSIAIFLALVAGYNGFVNVIFPITYPVDLPLNHVGYAIGLYDDTSLINNSEEWQAKYNLYRYGIVIPVIVAFLYLLSCWVTFVLNNVGTPRHLLAIMLAVALFLLYAVLYGYSALASQMAA
jgi:hypothetical protein